VISDPVRLFGDWDVEIGNISRIFNSL